MLLGIEGLDVLGVVLEDREDGSAWRLVHLVTGDDGAAACPSCGTVSTAPKGRATTRPRDLPYGPDPVRLVWRKRRWRCREPSALGPRSPSLSRRCQPGPGSRPACERPAGPVSHRDSRAWRRRLRTPSQLTGRARRVRRPRHRHPRAALAAGGGPRHRRDPPRTTPVGAGPGHPAMVGGARPLAHGRGRHGRDRRAPGSRRRPDRRRRRGLGCRPSGFVAKRGHPRESRKDSDRAGGDESRVRHPEHEHVEGEGADGERCAYACLGPEVGLRAGRASGMVDISVPTTRVVR